MGKRDNKRTIYDTAGLRESLNPIEKEGAKRALDLSKKVNMAIYVVAADQGFTEQDKNNISNIINTNKSILIILNKIDLINDKKSNDIITKINNYLKSLKKVSPDVLAQLPSFGIPLAKRIKEQVGGLVKSKKWKKLQTRESLELRPGRRPGVLVLSRTSSQSIRLCRAIYYLLGVEDGQEAEPSMKGISRGIGFLEVGGPEDVRRRNVRPEAPN